MNLNKKLYIDELKIEDKSAQPTVVELTEENFQSHIDRYDLVVIVFYVDTCKFSQKWNGVLEDIVDRAAVEFDNKVLLGRVNSKQQESLSNRFNISFYPSVHFVLHQQIYRLKYRDLCSVEAILGRIRSLLAYDPVRLANDYSDYEHIDVNEAAIIAYSGVEFSVQDSQYEKYRQCAVHLNHIATFYWAYGELATDLRSIMDSQHSLVITYKPPGSTPMDSMHWGLKLDNIITVDSFTQWAANQELPLLQHHTIDNPHIFKSSFDSKLLLLLYYDDPAFIGTFYELIRRELSTDQWMGLQLVAVNATTTPITELDRLKASKPVVAFRQDADQIFYPYRGDFKQLQTSGQLKCLLDDYYSGDLQRQQLEAEEKADKEQVHIKEDESEEKRAGFGLFC